MKQEFKIISNLIQKSTRVLDVGCGNGELMEFLKYNKAIDIRGIEISKNMFKYAFLKALQLLREMLKKTLHNSLTTLLIL